MSDVQRKATLALENSIRRSSAPSTVVKGADEVQKATIAQLTPSKVEAQSAENGLRNLANAQASLKNANVGLTGGAKQTFGQLLVAMGIAPEATGDAVKDTQAYEAAVTKNIIPLLRAAKISRITNYDISLFSKPAGAKLTMTKEALMEVLDRASEEFSHQIDEHNRLARNVLGKNYADALPAWTVENPMKPSPGVAVKHAGSPTGYGVLDKDGVTWRVAPAPTGN
jgi:hypothetical protein